jgi:crossover junction endodeoxyribonuclease RusA
MSEIKLTLPYPPSLNRLYRMVNGRFQISKVGKGYKNEIMWLCKVNRVQPLASEIACEFKFYRPQKRGDIDNLFKVLADSLIGSCYCDDSQIKEIHAYRFDDKLNPRVEIEIREI